MLGVAWSVTIVNSINFLYLHLFCHSNWYLVALNVEVISKKERSEALQYKRRPRRMFGLFIVPEVPGSQAGMLRVLERIFQLNRWDLIILEFLEYDEDIIYIVRIHVCNLVFFLADF